MKHIFIIVWCLIITAGNSIANIDFVTLQQLEIFYVLSGLCALNNTLSKKEFKFILLSFSIYYGLIFLTDQFVTTMSKFAVNFESVLFCAIISIGLILREK